MLYLGTKSPKLLMIKTNKTKDSIALFLTSIVIYDKISKISQKVSVIPICCLEWDSQDPPLFPGLPEWFLIVT